MDSLQEKTVNQENCDTNTGSDEQGDLLAFAYQLGSHGILFPNGVTRGEAAMLLHTIDKMIIEKYSPSFVQLHDSVIEECGNMLFQLVFDIDNGRIYDTLKEKLLSLTQKDYTDLDRIKQSLAAFESGLYFPCACGVLSMIEGTMGRTLGSTDTRLYFLLNQISEKSKHKEKAIILAGLKGFVSQLAKSERFNNPDEPAFINRHWLLHGRSKRSIGKYDCLRLLVAYCDILQLIFEE